MCVKVGGGGLEKAAGRRTSVVPSCPSAWREELSTSDDSTSTPLSSAEQRLSQSENSQKKSRSSPNPNPTHYPGPANTSATRSFLMLGHMKLLNRSALMTGHGGSSIFQAITQGWVNIQPEGPHWVSDVDERPGGAGN